MSESNIIKYLPLFLQDYMQYQLLMSTEDVELNNIFLALKKLEQNQFIISADDDGLKRFEKILEIYSQPEETIENRKMKVLSKWNEQEMYTFRFLKSKLDVICGRNNYEIIEDFENYYLEIHTHLSEIGEVKELERAIYSIIPCNIVVNIKNDIICSSKGESVVSGAMSMINIFDCSTEE